MHPHGHVLRPPGDDELDVDAVGEHVGRADVRSRGQVAGLRKVIKEDDGVRIGHQDTGGRPVAVADRDLWERPRPRRGRVAHVDGDGAVVIDARTAQPAPGGDDDVVVGDQAGRVEIPDEHASPVAAHLGQGAVGVAVVHEELGHIRELGELGDVLRAHHPQHSVAAHAHMAVAQPPHLVGAQVESTVDIGNDDEIVPRAVPLHEGHFIESGHVSRVAGAGQAPVAPAAW